MQRPRIVTDPMRNLQHVQPILGVLLIASFVLLVLGYIRNSVDELASTLENVHTELPADMSGSIRVAEVGEIAYNSFVSFEAKVSYTSGAGINLITVACFQQEHMVYQRTAQVGTRFLLQDQRDRSFSWDGADASCSAVLLRRVEQNGTAHVYLIDSVSFDVVGA